MSSTTFNITTTKQKLTRKLNILQELIEDASQYRPEWEFPSDDSELKLFVLTNQISVSKLKQQLDEQAEQTWTLYESSIQALTTMEEGKAPQEAFNEYWEEKKGDQTISVATLLSQQLYKRLIELECQAAAFTLSQNNSTHYSGNNSIDKEGLQETLIQQINSLVLDQQLLGGDIKLPEFYGNPSEFGPFWELFEELVHKQPFSNIRKLSILLSCCKGDAARCLQMIPRTADSYEKAIEQLKDQYEDPKRTTIQMIRQLASMKPCNNDPRSLRNNLNDIKAIVATLHKQGEMLDNTYMATLVTETFPKSIQEEVASKQFDSGCEWTMDDLLTNLTTIIKRREFIESRNENPHEQHSIFHSRTREQSVPHCIGCGRAHPFINCDKYRTIPQMIGRLKSLGACWKCFTLRHKTRYCHRPDCTNCGGHHNPILCQRQTITSNCNTILHPTSYGQSAISDTKPLRRSSLFPRRRRQNTTNVSTNNSSSVANCGIPTATPNRAQNGFPSLSNYDTEANPSTGATFRQTHQYSKAATMNKLITANVNCQMSLPSHPDTEAEFISGKTSSARLMVVPLKIQNKSNNKEEQVYALLDSASDQSFITASLSKRLQLKPRSEVSIRINTFGGHIEKKHVKRVEALLRNAQTQSLNVALLTNDTITKTISLLELSKEDKFFLKSNFPNLQDSWLLNATTQVIPDILLGIDYFNIILNTNEPGVHLPSGLHMTPTFFGHVISGVPHSKNIETEASPNNVINAKHSQYTHKQRNPNHSNLWKTPHVGTEKLHTTVELKKHIVSNSNPNNSPHYTLDQAAIKSTSTANKIRIVRNVSPQMERQPRLNEIIHKGPIISSNLSSILTANLGSKMITADIQKSMHTISLQKSGRHSVRLIWLKDLNVTSVSNSIRSFPFCHLPFITKASPLPFKNSLKYGTVKQSKKWNKTTIIRSNATFISLTPAKYSYQQPILPPTKTLRCEHSARACRNQTTLITSLNQMQTETLLQLRNEDHQIHNMHISIRSLLLRPREELLSLTRNIPQSFSVSLIPIHNQRFFTDKRTTAAALQVSYSCSADKQTTNQTIDCKITNTCKRNPTENHYTHKNGSISIQLSHTPPLPIGKSLVSTAKLDNISTIRQTKLLSELVPLADPLKNNNVQDNKNFQLQCPILLKQLMITATALRKRNPLFSANQLANTRSTNKLNQQQFTKNCIQTN